MWQGLAEDERQKMGEKVCKIILYYIIYYIIYIYSS